MCPKPRPTNTFKSFPPPAKLLMIELEPIVKNEPNRNPKPTLVLVTSLYEIGK